MGLDQYLEVSEVDFYTPGCNKAELAYWRKDWPLQHFINSDNCKDLVLTSEICEDVLSNLSTIYVEDTYYKKHTKHAFEQALELINSGKEVTYYGWW